MTPILPSTKSSDSGGIRSPCESEWLGGAGRSVGAGYTGTSDYRFEFVQSRGNGPRAQPRVHHSLASKGCLRCPLSPVQLVIRTERTRVIRPWHRGASAQSCPSSTSQDRVQRTARPVRRGPVRTRSTPAHRRNRPDSDPERPVGRVSEGIEMHNAHFSAQHLERPLACRIAARVHVGHERAHATQ